MGENSRVGRVYAAVGSVVGQPIPSVACPTVKPHFAACKYVSLVPAHIEAAIWPPVVCWPARVHTLLRVAIPRAVHPVYSFRNIDPVLNAWIKNPQVEGNTLVVPHIGVGREVVEKPRYSICKRKFVELVVGHNTARLRDSLERQSTNSIKSPSSGTYGKFADLVLRWAWGSFAGPHQYKNCITYRLCFACNSSAKGIGFPKVARRTGSSKNHARYQRVLYPFAYKFPACGVARVFGRELIDPAYSKHPNAGRIVHKLVAAIGTGHIFRYFYPFITKGVVPKNPSSARCSIGGGGAVLKIAIGFAPFVE